MITIVNAVGSGDLKMELDVSEIESDLDLPHTEYDPSNYHGLYVRLTEEGPLITIYRSGKYIISGCSSLEHLYRVNEEFLMEMSSLLGFTGENIEPSFSVQNLVCTGQLQGEIDLNTLSLMLGLESVEYEPEQFPGVIYRPVDYSAVLLIFATGKVVITGGKDVETAEQLFSHLEEQVEALLLD